MTATYWEHPEAASIGPCRCQGCGEPLWWALGPFSFLGVPTVKTTWREEDGAVHRCPNVVDKPRADSAILSMDEPSHRGRLPYE